MTDATECLTDAGLGHVEGLAHALVVTHEVAVKLTIPPARAVSANERVIAALETVMLNVSGELYEP